MKKIGLLSMTLMLVLTVGLTGCGGGGKSSTSSTGSNTNGGKGDTSIYKVGDSSEYKVGTTSTKTFKMIYVPAMAFLTNCGDSAAGTVSTGYWMAETEVNFDLWKKVHEWATMGTDGDGGTAANATGAGKYKFANNGGGSTNNVNYPVYSINWRDALVWCNALTEYYNATNKKNDTCVYTCNGEILRDATNTTYCDAVIAGSTATGFRLPTSMEWELAARYVKDKNGDRVLNEKGEYYCGSYASGADARYDATLASEDLDDNGGYNITSKVAVYSSGSVSAVKSLNPNKLNIYDMSGNVAEWCFDQSGSNRIYRGGAYNSTAAEVQIGKVYSAAPTNCTTTVGLRVVKTAGGSNVSNVSAFGSLQLSVTGAPATHTHKWETADYVLGHKVNTHHHQEEHTLFYNITATGPDKTITETSLANTDLKKLFELLTPGQWKVTVQGYCTQNTGWLHCQGETTVEVSAGQTATATIAIKLVNEDH